jgi:NADH-quinone oxidoreductase subunit L
VGIPLITVLDTPLGFAGFLSKDVIIESTYAASSSAGKFAFTLLVAAAAMTSFYSWRLIFMTFYGSTRADEHTYDHAHEENHVLKASHGVPILVKLSPFVAMVLGFGIAYQMYIRKPHLPALLAAQQPALYQFLLNKWYFDEIYEFLFVRPAKWIGHTLWKRGDGSVIDGFLNGVAMGLVPLLTRFAGRMQSGYLFHYAFVMLIGVSLLITWFAVTGGSR